MHTNSPFIQSLIQRCRKNPGRVIFPEGNDPRVLDAAKLLLTWNAVSEIKLITTSNGVANKHADTRLTEISSLESSLVSLTKVTYESFLAKKQKTADADVTKKISHDPLYQAGAMLAKDETDCVVAGCVATTSDVIRASLATVGLAQGINTVSGSFIMDRSKDQKNETYLYADCGVVIEPSIEQLVDIAAGSISTFQKITGLSPVVAFLSFSTKGSADHPSARKMRMAADLFKRKHPEIDCDGEMQFDTAFVSDVGKRKAPSSNVPGRANCFIFPDLNAGNIAYKITQRLASFGAYGPILQGLARPYSDLSRGASAEDIAISALINILRSR